ncbi:MAG: hypothetical protein HYX48_02910 [Chlamydiales bacterium]|nr:hypothetical protein [Chlamydiales bacterium]
MIRTIVIFFAAIPLLLFGNKVELIADWPIAENDPVCNAISKILIEKGDALALSDLKAYRPFLEKECRETLKLNPDIKRLVFWNIPQKMSKLKFGRLPKEKLVLFMWEPPTVQKRLYTKKVQDFFSKIYTWDDSLVDNVRFFKFYYPVLRKMRSDLPSFEKKKLCTLVISNKKSRHPQELYTAREEVIQFFEQKGGSDFEFYGWGWESAGYSNYRGTAADKLEVLKDFRFSFCYENMQGGRGYVTEKIFDSFAAGCVPIYWGASNIEEYVPQNCFIDRRKFKDNDELYSFLKKMSKEEYEGYLKRIAVWLESDQAKRFSIENFAKIFSTCL